MMFATTAALCAWSSPPDRPMTVEPQRLGPQDGIHTGKDTQPIVSHGTLQAK
jgi:hypothetical protein